MGTGGIAKCEWADRVFTKGIGGTSKKIEAARDQRRKEIMRVVLQRVASAEVKVAGDVVGKINRGIMLLFGVHREDVVEDLKAIEDLATKCAELRIFPDAEGKMNLSCADVGGEALVVSQFTLYGDCRKGRRPNFMDAAKPEKAQEIYDCFVEALRGKLAKVETGEFGAQMQIALVNDGPVTLVIDDGGER